MVPVLTIVLALGLSLVAVPAQAYLDPGTGSFVFQMVAAWAIAAAFFLKAGWRWLRAALARLRRSEPRNSPDGR